MRMLNIQAVALAAFGASTAVQAAGNQTDYVQPIQDRAFAALEQAEPEAVLERNSTCTLENAGVRKNW